MRSLRPAVFSTVLLLVCVVFQATTVAAASTDAFTGAWTATDTDGSTLHLQISAPNVSGVRHVTLVDQFASVCGAPATAIGLGTVSGTTLSATLDVRCGGAPSATGVPLSFDLVGDDLVSGGTVFTRVGGG
jgi:hypothetical protein